VDGEVCYRKNIYWYIATKIELEQIDSNTWQEVEI
jgi:hypothetical protein